MVDSAAVTVVLVEWVVELVVELVLSVAIGAKVLLANLAPGLLVHGLRGMFLRPTAYTESTC
jgi:hypothetical protein